ncbi:hypothetical protein RHSIM_Rhsim10G0085300 [Rhododendron simsii]|uniref:DUF4283 domain-containing protein n=1 Tax=Rhododendron simsii TaxID=118357 RepID=A0A834GBI4_RHOSS|nr:hypothetical protein RHSIM_Rhsim10G0085300 [Rhododendron simsii]
MRQEGDKNGNLASSVHKGLPKSVAGLGSSFADVVADGNLNQPSRPIVKACDEGFDWLHRSAIGILPSPRNVAFFREAFIAGGISYIQAREMGGNLVLLIFDSLEDMSLMLEEAGKCWLRNWFVDVKKWSPDLKFVSKREVAVLKNRVNIACGLWYTKQTLRVIPCSPFPKSGCSSFPKSGCSSFSLFLLPLSFREGFIVLESRIQYAFSLLPSSLSSTRACSELWLLVMAIVPICSFSMDSVLLLLRLWH